MTGSLQAVVSPGASDGETLQPFSVRLHAYARQQLMTAQKQLARQGTARHEGIHQARKCIRRAKSALAIGRTVFGKRGLSLNAELGRLCRGLSPLRDAQALLEELHRLRRGADAASHALLTTAETAASQRRDQLLKDALAKDPQLKHRRARLQQLVEKMQRLEWERVDREAVSAAIHRSECRLEKTGMRLNQALDADEAWHEYRRRLRRLRQQASLLAELGIDIGLPEKHIKEQTDSLGEAQDHVMLIRHCGSRSPFGPGLRKPLRDSARQRLHNVRAHWILQH
jgi:CHAD domain-containing protein